MAYNNFNFTSPGYVPSYNLEWPATEFRLIAGFSQNFAAVWAEADANIETSRMYIATAGTGAAFSVIDLSNKILLDSYTQIDGGDYEEPLERDDIKDINVR